MIGSHTGTPQAYLNQFAAMQKPTDRRAKVWVYQRGAEPFTATPKRVGKENGYFTVVGADGASDESVETLLAELEGPGAKLLPLISYETFFISPKDAEVIAAYVALLFTRTTARRKFSAKIFEDIRKAYKELTIDPGWLRDQAARYKHFSGADATPDEISNIFLKVLDRLAKPEHIRNIFVQGLLHLANEILTDLVGKPLQVWEAPELSPFITTDNPVITFSAASGRVSTGCGFRTPGFIAAFPVSPRCCVVIGEGIRGRPWRRATAAEVNYINRALVQCMDRWAYSRKFSAATRQMVDAVGGSLRYGVNIFMRDWMKNATEDIRAKVRSATFPKTPKLRSVG